MKFVGAYSLHSGDAEWQRRDLYEWLTDLFESPSIEIEPGCTGRIRAHLRDELTNAGWSYSVRVDPNFDLTVTGRFRDLAFQIQTGNISRAMYDLLKMEYLYKQKKIAIEDNAAGFDILSYDQGPVEPVSRLIEVKSSTQNPPRITLTRNEWEAATRFDQSYIFHIWTMPARTLIERSVADMVPHIPKDEGSGVWTSVEITVRR
jgi:Domain of unknown function (DUF3883)